MSLEPILGTQIPLTALLEPGVIMTGVLSVLGTWWLILRGRRPVVFFALALVILLPSVLGGFAFISRLEIACWILSSSGKSNPQGAYKYIQALGESLYGLRLGVGFTLLNLFSCAIAMSFLAFRSRNEEADQS